MSFLGSGKAATSAGKFTSTLKNLSGKITGTIKKSDDAPSGASGLTQDEVSLSAKRSGSKPGIPLSEAKIKHIQDTEDLLRLDTTPGGVRDLNLKHLKQKEIEILTATGRKADAKKLEKMSTADYDAYFKAKAPTDSIVPAEALPKAAATSSRSMAQAAPRPQASTQAADAGDMAARRELQRQLRNDTRDISAGLKAKQTQVQARFEAPDVAASKAKQEQLNKNGALLEQQIEMAAALQEQGKALEANKVVQMSLKDFEAHLAKREQQSLPKLPPRPIKTAESMGGSSQPVLKPPPLPIGPKPKVDVNKDGKQAPPPPPRKQASNQSLPVAAPRIRVASPDIAAGGPILPIEAATSIPITKRVPPPRPVVKKLSADEALAALERQMDAAPNAGSTSVSTRGLFSPKDQAQIDKALQHAKKTEAEAVVATKSANQAIAKQDAVNRRMAQPIIKSSVEEEAALQAELAALMAGESTKATAKAATASVSAPKVVKATTTTSPEQQAKLKQKQAELDVMKRQAARAQQISDGLIQTQQVFASLNKHNNELLGGKIEKLHKLIQSPKTNAEQKAQLRKKVADLRAAQERNRGLHKDFMDAIQAQRYDAANVLQQNLQRNFESQKKQFFPEG